MSCEVKKCNKRLCVIKLCLNKGKSTVFVFQIKDFHRRHPGEISVPISVEFEELKKIRETGGDNEAGAVAMVDFSEEESFGRFLDLHGCHQVSSLALLST